VPETGSFLSFTAQTSTGESGVTCRAETMTGS
jgi:hypothetical protein